MRWVRGLTFVSEFRLWPFMGLGFLGFRVWRLSFLVLGFGFLIFGLCQWVCGDRQERSPGCP